MTVPNATTGRARKPFSKERVDQQPIEPRKPRASNKLEQLAALLAQPDGATIAELTSATGWQKHSVRGALAGALKKRGWTVTSDKADGVRRYRATRA